jgi:hypothetical protein
VASPLTDDIEQGSTDGSTALALAPSANRAALVLHHDPEPTRNPALVYLASLAKSSRVVMAHALGVVARILTGDGAPPAAIDWGAVRYEHTQLIRAVLQDRYEPATANRHLSALRGVLREAWRLGLVPAEAYHRAIDIGRVRGQPLPAGRALSAGELRALFAACADAARTRRGQASGARDAALLGVLYGGGLRRAEAVSLTPDDYDAAESSLKVRRGGRSVGLDGGERQSAQVLTFQEARTIGKRAVRAHQCGAPVGSVEVHSDHGSTLVRRPSSSANRSPRCAGMALCVFVHVSNHGPSGQAAGNTNSTGPSLNLARHFSKPASSSDRVQVESSPTRQSHVTSLRFDGSRWSWSCLCIDCLPC